MGLQPVQSPPTEAGRLNDVVAEEVRALMARRRLSQTTVAKMMGITQSQFSKRMLGKIVFDVEEISRLAEIFGVWPEELLGGSGRTETPPPGGGVWANSGDVRHQGLEPRTRWFRAFAPEYDLAA